MYLRINASAISGRTNDNTILPRVSLRLPWAMRLLGFQPAPAKSETLVIINVLSLKTRCLK